MSETIEAGIPELANKFTELFANAAAEGIGLHDEREMQSSFLAASLAGDVARCRQMIEDVDSRLGATRTAQRIEEQCKAVDREILHLEALFHPTGRTQGAIADGYRRFAEAKAARDVEACRELVRIASNFSAAALRPPWEIERDVRAASEAAAAVVAEARQREARAAEVARWRARYRDAGVVLPEIEKRGSLRIGPDGAVLYTGLPLEEGLLLGLEWHARDVRIALEQRWHDRVLIPAPEPAGPAAQAAA